METLKTILTLWLFFSFFFTDPEAFTSKGILLWFAVLVITVNLP